MEDIITQGWQMEIRDIRKVQDNVWQIQTEAGLFALKRSLLKEKNLRFICAAEESLPRHGFTRFARLQKTAEGELFHREDSSLFTLHQWITGQKCDFDSAEHLFSAAASLGDFHLRSREKTLRTLSPGRSNCFAQAERLQGRIRELHRFYHLSLSEPQNRFTRLYRFYYPPFTAKAINALNALLSSEYPRLAAEAKTVGSFIHYDVAARNFIIGKDGAYLIDFDYCCGGLPLTDLMRLTKRAMKKGENFEKKIDAICNGYQQNRKLTAAEANVLCAMLLFPQKFWRLSHRYFCENRERDEDFYVKKMLLAAEELEKEDRWLAKLKDKLEVLP
ncbi:MAG: CotS family spore coat protein [Clostridia bacterium]